MRNVLLILFPLIVTAQIEERRIGSTTVRTGSLGATLNAAGTFFGTTWPVTANGPLGINRVLWYATGVTGTLGANDLGLEVLRQIAPNSEPIVTVTYNDGADTVAASSHLLSNGDRVKFTAATSLPAGLSAATKYYVCNVASGTFQVDDDPGCSSVVTDYSGAAGNQMVRWIVDESNTVTSVPTGAGWVEHTGLTASLSPANLYHFLWRNNNATPGANYFSLGAGAVGTGGTITGSRTSTGSTPAYWSTTTAGSSYNSGGPWVGLRVEYSGGSYAGFPYFAYATGATDRAYDTRMAGVRMVLPSSFGASLRVIGGWLCLTKAGTPASDLALRLYGGADGNETLLATSNTVSRLAVSTNSSNGGCLVTYFPSPQTLAANAVVRIVAAAASTGDTSSNGYTPSFFSIENSAPSKALSFWSSHKAYFDGSAWSYEDTKTTGAGFILDAQYTASGGSSGASFTFIQ